jgi:hypothetical protein
MFTLTITTNSAAFDGGMCDHEIARLLRDVATRIEIIDHPNRGSLFDTKGNRVGKWELQS